MVNLLNDARTQNLELEGLMLKIYLYMLKLKRPMSINENPFSDIRHEVKYNLEKMEKRGVIIRNVEGEYFIAEDKMLDTVLTQLLNRNVKKLRRYAFYSAFLFTSMILFVLYIFFLPQTLFTTKFYAISIALFSITIIVIEILQELRHNTMMDELLT